MTQAGDPQAASAVAVAGPLGGRMPPLGYWRVRNAGPSECPGCCLLSAIPIPAGCNWGIAETSVVVAVQSLGRVRFFVTHGLQPASPGLLCGKNPACDWTHVSWIAGRYLATEPLDRKKSVHDQERQKGSQSAVQKSHAFQAAPENPATLLEGLTQVLEDQQQLSLRSWRW